LTTARPDSTPDDRSSSMRKLIESSFVSLDGYVSAEKLAPYWSAENKTYALAELDHCDAFLFGRKTYELFAPRWSKIEGDSYMDLINRMPKHVASTTLKESELSWNASLLPGPAPKAIARLKELPGKHIMKYGTGELDRSLIEHRLIDEFRFSIFPVVLGQGKRLFEGCSLLGLSLDLLETKTFANGIVRVRYAARYADTAA
jgi:dihydrofolate reductase